MAAAMNAKKSRRAGRAQRRDKELGMLFDNALRLDAPRILGNIDLGQLPIDHA